MSRYIVVQLCGVVVAGLVGRSPITTIVENNKWKGLSEDAPSTEAAAPIQSPTATELSSVIQVSLPENGPSTPLITSAPAPLDAAIRSPSAAEAENAKVTHVESWLESAQSGKYRMVTKTYEYDREDMDYEPDEYKNAPIPDQTTETTNIGGIPVISINPDDAFQPPPPTTAPAMENTQHGIPFYVLNNLYALQQKLNDIQRRKKEYREGQPEMLQLQKSETEVLQLITRLEKSGSRPRVPLKWGEEAAPAIHELELIFGMPGSDKLITATFASSPVPAVVVSSQTLRIGGPAATIHNNVVSFAPQGLVMPSQTIPIPVLEPARPTDYGVAMTVDNTPMTFIKPAGNPGIMTMGDATLTAGGDPISTKGHHILYNSYGDVIVDGTDKIEPTPLPKGVGGSLPPPGQSGKGGGEGSDGNKKKPEAKVGKGGIQFDASFDKSQNGPKWSSSNQAVSGSSNYADMGEKGNGVAAQQDGLSSEAPTVTGKSAKPASSELSTSKMKSAGSSITWSGVSGMAVLTTLLSFSSLVIMVIV